MSQYRLLRERRFRPFFITQFLGAFNDNVFKSALLIFVAFKLTGETAEADANTLVNVAQALFILPFFLFSALAGQIADKYEKSRLIRRIKLVEIVLMGMAAAAFAAEHTAALIFVLFLMGSQSAFFGPVKYAILPQALAEEELVGGNGLVEMGTFLAILLGTLLGAELLGAGPGLWLVGALLLLVSVLGWLASRGIPTAPATDPGLTLGWNLLGETWRIVQTARANRTVFLSILGISWFWGFGAILLAQLPTYTKGVLGGDEDTVKWLLTTFSLGIGVGSLLCERMSGRVVELGLVPFGAFGLSLFAFDLVLASGPLSDGGLWRVLLDLFLLSMFGGFFIVPLYALVQSRSEPSQRSRIIAANNILNALFVVIASLVTALLLARGLSIPQVFGVAAACNVVVAVFIFTLVPEFLMRFIVWMLIHTVYRLEIEGIDQVPDEGPAVIACNHVSFVDALIITAACPRPIRFIMDHGIYRTAVLHFVFRTVRAIPIRSAREDPEAVVAAFDEVARGLEAGDLIGIFPEGKITYDGELNPFRPGVKQIVDRTPVPVVPMALQGLWGSFFSRREGAAMSRPYRILAGLRSPISLRVGEPIPPQALEVERLQETVREMRGEKR